MSEWCSLCLHKIYTTIIIFFFYSRHTVSDVIYAHWHVSTGASVSLRSSPGWCCVTRLYQLLSQRCNPPVKIWQVGPVGPLLPPRTVLPPWESIKRSPVPVHRPRPSLSCCFPVLWLWPHTSWYKRVTQLLRKTEAPVETCQGTKVTCRIVKLQSTNSF